jgi:hypothetical protein
MPDLNELAADLAAVKSKLVEIGDLGPRLAALEKAELDSAQAALHARFDEIKTHALAEAEALKRHVSGELAGVRAHVTATLDAALRSKPLLAAAFATVLVFGIVAGLAGGMRIERHVPAPSATAEHR